MRLFLALLLISFSAVATTWDDLELGKSYKLTQSFQLPIKANRNSLLDIMKGEEVTYVEQVPIYIPGNALVLFLFNYKNCPGPQMTTDLELVPVQGTDPVVEVGASVQEGCELNVYVEAKDYYTQSLFE